MERQLWPLIGAAAGVLLALGAFRTAFRMLDGGAPWPLAALLFAAGAALLVPVFRLWRRRSGPGRRWSGKEHPAD